jgi:hypothetical protein
MSVRNFVPTQWAKNIDKALDEFLIAAEFCNQEYTGLVKQAGDQIRIQQAIRPTITTTTDGKPITLSTPETPDGTSMTMTMLRQSYYDFVVHDVDKAQAQGELEAILKGEAVQGVANAMDKHIFELAKDNSVKKSSSTDVDNTNVLSTINAGLAELYKNNVPPNADIEIDISPAFHTVFLEAYEKLDTNNSEMLKKGIVGRYGFANVKMSNNIYNDGTDDYIVIRTKKAIAFAKPLTEVYAVDAGNAFGDRIKGFTLYQAKIARPKEIYVIKAH